MKSVGDFYAPVIAWAGSRGEQAPLFQSEDWADPGGLELFLFSFHSTPLQSHTASWLAARRAEPLWRQGPLLIWVKKKSLRDPLRLLHFLREGNKQSLSSVFWALVLFCIWPRFTYSCLFPFPSVRAQLTLTQTPANDTHPQLTES